MNKNKRLTLTLLAIPFMALSSCGNNVGLQLTITEGTSLYNEIEKSCLDNNINLSYLYIKENKSKLEKTNLETLFNKQTSEYKVAFDQKMIEYKVFDEDKIHKHEIILKDDFYGFYLKANLIDNTYIKIADLTDSDFIKARNFGYNLLFNEMKNIINLANTGYQDIASKKDITFTLSNQFSKIDDKSLQYQDECKAEFITLDYACLQSSHEFYLKDNTPISCKIYQKNTYSHNKNNPSEDQESLEQLLDIKNLNQVPSFTEIDLTKLTLIE